MADASSGTNGTRPERREPWRRPFRLGSSISSDLLTVIARGGGGRIHGKSAASWLVRFRSDPERLPPEGRLWRGDTSVAAGRVRGGGTVGGSPALAAAAGYLAEAAVAFHSPWLRRPPNHALLARASCDSAGQLILRARSRLRVCVDTFPVRHRSRVRCSRLVFSGCSLRRVDTCCVWPVRVSECASPLGRFYGTRGAAIRREDMQ